LGPYEVLALLGTGGMAEVYRARDTRLGREVAIKVVSESLGGHGAWLERLQREAQLAGALNHPNVVSLYDVGVHDTRPFFVTELLEGESLRERMQRGPVLIATALDCVESALDSSAAWPLPSWHAGRISRHIRARVGRPTHPRF
jgi:serine/threonine protein kinase